MFESREADLASLWQQLIKDSSPVRDENSVVLKLILTAYGELHRHYHNLEHLFEVLTVCNLLQSNEANSPDARWALWFHDVVYDPRAKDNEERSADFAEVSIRTFGMPHDQILRMRELILATKHNGLATITSDVATVLDSDLAILGSPAERYDRYAAEIRREYDFVLESDYHHGRTNVLKHFLQIPRLYHSKKMEELGITQKRAHENMNREIESLRS